MSILLKKLIQVKENIYDESKYQVCYCDKFDELVKEAEQEYYKKILREEPRGDS